MWPVVYSAHALHQHFTLSSYGVAIALGFLAAIFLGGRAARKQGEDQQAVLELCFWLLVSSMIGARVLYVITNWRTFGECCKEGVQSGKVGFAVWSCTRALHVWEGGLVFFGGLLSAIGFAVWWTRRRGMNFARVADVLAPQIALGHFFGRLGCFAAGCCWGKPAAYGAHLAVRFPSESIAFQQLVTDGQLSPAASLTPPLVPVQLYEALGNLALYSALSLLAVRKRWHGQVLVAYLIGYAILRFTTELYRGDVMRHFVIPGLSTSQAISITLVPLALWLWWRWRARVVA
jgi:phosphatidylglycerol:prolipoprotein diacylglycerol transferase